MNTRYTQMVIAPAVLVEPHSYFFNSSCGDRDTHAPNETKDNCYVVGAYDNDDIIYIDKNMSGELLDMILVHELVHHFQYHSHLFSNSCEDKIAREKEAYAIENEFAWKVLRRVETYDGSIGMYCGKQKTK